MPESERERALAFLRALDVRRADRVEELPHGLGLAVFAHDLPLVHDQNKAIAAPEVGRDQVANLVEHVERIQSDAGLRHRKVAFDDEDACSSLVDWFSRRGWRQRPLRLMVHRGPPPAEDAVGRAREVEPGELQSATYAFASEEPWGRSAEARRQVVAGDELTARAVDERAFGVATGDAIVAYCRLYSAEGVGQIENVTTLSAHRRQGYARALVSLALRASLLANELTFLVAEGADWPRHFYERMGFDDVGGFCEFNRPGS